MPVYPASLDAGFLFISKIGKIFLLRKIPTRRQYEKSFWLAVLIGISCVWPVWSHAQGIQAGDQFISVYAGAGGATNDTHLGLDFRDDTGYPLGQTKDFGWGDESVAFGAQYLYTVSPYWAFGAEYNANLFDGAAEELNAWGGSGQHMKAEADQDMDVHNLMAAGRFTLNPQGTFRFYIPFGAGIAFSKATVKNSFWEQNGGAYTSVSDSRSESSRSFTYYAGLGVEHRLAGQWLWGLEGRYQSFSFDYDKFLSGAGRENLHYVTVFLKLWYVF